VKRISCAVLLLLPLACGGTEPVTEEIGNFGTGPTQWGVGPIEGAALPDEFRVDYVRVSRYIPP
jgi:hypothetical protein